jgi:hypothetical protein
VSSKSLGRDVSGALLALFFEVVALGIPQPTLCNRFTLMVA